MFSCADCAETYKGSESVVIYAVSINTDLQGILTPPPPPPILSLILKNFMLPVVYI